MERNTNCILPAILRIQERSALYMVLSCRIGKFSLKFTETLLWNICNKGISSITCDIDTAKVCCSLLFTTTLCNFAFIFLHALRNALKKISGTKGAPLGHRLTVRKIGPGPLGAPFWCHFRKGHCFPIHFLYKNSARGTKIVPFQRKGSCFPKWCPKGAISVLFFLSACKELHYQTL